VLPLHAGEERAVAATKTYLNSIAAMALLSTLASGDETRLAELLAMPEAVKEQIESAFSIAGRLDRYRDAESGSVIARGVNYGTAFEIALKIRELSGAAFEAFSSADLLHGPIAALKPGRPAIVIAPSGRTLASLQTAVEQIRERGAGMIAISDDAEFRSAADVAFPLVRGVPEWLSPLLAVIPGQVAAVRLATLHGTDVDYPVGLSKITLTL
jgi:glucosamine--fructose-6-phosphate aminotransferase (isomerizing)